MSERIFQRVKTPTASWFRIFGYGLMFKDGRVSVLGRDSSWMD